MAKINKHGLVINGLRSTSGETYEMRYTYAEIFYRMSTGDTWVIHLAGYPGSSWTHYHDPDVIRVASGVQTHITMQQLANMIRDAVDDHTERVKEWKALHV